MDYIYRKQNEQYFHLIRLAHFVDMLEYLSNTFINVIWSSLLNDSLFHYPYHQIVTQ
jgi:hypothetical protein